MFDYFGDFLWFLNNVFHNERSSATVPLTSLASQTLTLLQQYLSDPFFLQVVHVEPVMHHAIARNELLDVILHVLLEFQRQIAQV